MPTFMIVPSMACQASCTYCFGPHAGMAMDERTAWETARFVRRIVDEVGADRATVVFHGGEPLLAPIEVWRVLLARLRDETRGIKLSLSVQSNLWRMDAPFAALFAQYGVSVGTSLDGPEPLCDANRGEGYYRRTMAGVRAAHEMGLPVSGIATLTRDTAPQVEEVARFFRDRGMPLVLHGAVRGLGDGDAPWALSADEYAGALIRLFPWYVKHRKRIRIDTLDHYCHAMATGDPGVCTLKDCLGMFVCIAPDGTITGCQRLAGRADHALGNLFERPSLKQLMDSKPARAHRERQERVRERCGGCEVFELCRGGCYYNALASGDGVVDPMCEGYRRIYGFVRERLADELASDENLAALDKVGGGHSLLRVGAYTQLGLGLHPAQRADHARRIMAIYAMGRTRNDLEAAEWLFSERMCGDAALTARLLGRMRRGLYTRQSRLNNCYVHVTFDCNLRCGHCYAEGGERAEEMAVGDFMALAHAATGAGFDKLVITGGEPLTHGRRDELLAACQKLRGQGARLALRSNLFGTLPDEVLMGVARGFDQLIVSVDGDELTHDARRGAGSYRSTTDNLARYVALSRGVPRAAALSLAAVLSAEQIHGGPGAKVRELSSTLGAGQVRFRPMLPVGRAAALVEPVMCEGLMAHLTPEEWLDMPMHPMISCGIGQNLFIEPNGAAYPCYAWHGAHTALGNALTDGLDHVLASPLFARMNGCTVDTIERCRDCEYRYLCGGACRAWGNQSALDLNAAPPHCEHLLRRAEAVVGAARAYLVE